MRNRKTIKYPHYKTSRKTTNKNKSCLLRGANIWINIKWWINQIKVKQYNYSQVKCSDTIEKKNWILFTKLIINNQCMISKM